MTNDEQEWDTNFCFSVLGFKRVKNGWAMYVLEPGSQLGKNLLDSVKFLC